MPDISTLLAALQGAATTIASASVFALALRKTIPALRAHALASHIKAESSAVEAYALFVEGLANVCSGAQWLLDHVALNTTKGEQK